ncbi:MAG: hypothetical protein JW786_11555 [Desulfobacterales bacterium]|nr:hypothetical protein [Desulfobacterales bacterium]
MTYSKISRLKSKINHSGIDIVQRLSIHGALPLLEKDTATLSRLIHESATQSNAVFAAIVDHKNNIIVNTNPELLVFANEIDKTYTQGEVSFWAGVTTGDEKMIFSSDVTYSGTKIGKIYLALSTKEIHESQNLLIFIIFSSFIVLSAVLSIIYYNELRVFINRLKAFWKSNPDREFLHKKNLHIICPLCGSNQPMTQSIFDCVDLKNIPTIRSAEGELDSGVLRQSEGIFLADIAGIENLGWLKRQVIFRCAEIIKILST